MRDRPPPPLRPSGLGLAVSLIALAIVVGFSVAHVGEAKRFAQLVEHAQPGWLLVAALFQVVTYGCAGAIWGRAATAAGHPLPIAHLARFAVMKLSVDQFLPTGGLSGNVAVVRAMRRMGVPAAVATEALLIDVLSHYAAFACVISIALLVLALGHDVTPVLLGLIGAFSLLVAGVPLAIAWLLRHRDWRPPPRLARLRWMSSLLENLSAISSRRVWNPRLLTVATALQIGIVLLDAGTLWAALRALGAPIPPLSAFVALVVATISGTLSFLPGGIGGFEAGCTATLAMLGVPVEAALTGTLLLRGLTLWLPLVPGLLLARNSLERTTPPDQDIDASPDVALPELLEHLRTSRAGLTSEEARARSGALGPNTIAARRTRAAIGELLRAVASPLALILLAAAVASAFLGQVVDAAIIVSMVLLSGGINSWQSARSGRAVRGLQARVTPTATVSRDGAPRTIPRADVVVGDVIHLSAGDLIPADARLLEATDLHLQQAALTGESMPTLKRATEGALGRTGPDVDELVYVGTSVVSGTATAVVFATGARTAFGDVASRLAARPEETEFERGSRRFGVLILKTVVSLVLFILVVRIATGHDAFQSLLFAVALAVGLTPEYLPMITTVTLSQGAAQMAREKVIVRHLASIQNLGSVDVLCSDKTGTLTSGVMALDASLDPFGAPSGRPLELAHLNAAFETGVKSALDTAILARAGEAPAGYRKLAEIPFDFERRRLSVVVQTDGGKSLLVSKGAPEGILSCCSSLELDGHRRPFDEASRDASLERFRRLSEAGYRVLAVAYREIENDEPTGCEQERELVLSGFVTFADQLLDGVADAIEGLRADGVAIKILSGDNELVTRTLCRKVGIDGDKVVTGDALAPLDEVALARVAEEADVFARLSPAQKQRVVMALKHRGHVVGFLGDGINDAPSLHAADVGVSVAGAVDVAQEAADILLLEKRLDVLHAGILAGRRSFANVLKYLLMGTSSNFGNMASMAGAVFFLPFLPMLPTQILVNNFLYDLAQITIPTDNVDPAYLKGPQRWDIGTIRRFMLMIGPLSSLFDFVTFAILYAVFHFAEPAFQTGWFVESLTTQVLILFVIRTTGRPWKNRPSAALAITAVAVVLAGIALPYTPLAAPLGMTPLPARFFLLLAVVVPSYLVLVELVKARLLRRIVPGTTGQPSHAPS